MLWWGGDSGSAPLAAAAPDTAGDVRNANCVAGERGDCGVGVGPVGLGRREDFADDQSCCSVLLAIELQGDAGVAGRGDGDGWAPSGFAWAVASTEGALT